MSSILTYGTMIFQYVSYAVRDNAMAPNEPAGNTSRVAALDGLRGLLALLVVVSHVLRYYGIDWLRLPATGAVVCFFVLSGYVLTRSWRGDYVSFLARRFVRLWPVYALCLAVGYLIAWRVPIWTEFFWYPFMGANDPRHVDPPTWSLTLEAWAMPLMPVIVWAGTGSTRRAAAVLIPLVALAAFWKLAFLPIPFIAGAYFSREDFHNRWLEARFPQWLGKVSYSLYLSHVLVLLAFTKALGPIGNVVGIPFVFATAWLVWCFVENPSIWLSRRICNLKAGSVPRLA